MDEMNKNVIFILYYVGFCCMIEAKGVDFCGISITNFSGR